MSKQPNILILHTDQQRYNTLGCTGNPHTRTANLDRLAASSTVFTRHIVANTVCMPSRASLMTGLYPPGHNVWSNGVPLGRANDYGPEHLREWPNPATGAHATMADIFAQAGYDTVSLGKLHLTPNLADTRYGFGESFQLADEGKLSDWHGPYYGFRYIEQTKGHAEEPARGGHYADWLMENYPEIRDQLGNPKQLYPIKEKYDVFSSEITSDMHNSRWLADRFAAYLAGRGEDDAPFFAFVGFPDPHHAFTPPKDIMAQFVDADVLDPVDHEGAWWTSSPFGSWFNTRNNAITNLSLEERRVIIRHHNAMVHNIDLAVGRILETLEARGLLDDTIIVFTSDHGDYLCDHGLLYKTQNGVDCLLRVPFLLRAPGRDLPKQVDAPMSNCDVLPTLAALCGVAVPDGLHGRNILEVLDRNLPHHAFAYSQTGRPEHANFTIYDECYRLTHYPGFNHTELYDHRQDPAETRNLAQESAMQGTVDELMARIREAMLAHHAPNLCRLSEW